MSGTQAGKKTKRNRLKKLVDRGGWIERPARLMGEQEETDVRLENTKFGMGMKYQ